MEKVVAAENIHGYQPSARLEREPTEPSPLAPDDGVSPGPRREDLRQTSREHVEVLPAALRAAAGEASAEARVGGGGTWGWGGGGVRGWGGVRGGGGRVKWRRLA